MKTHTTVYGLRHAIARNRAQGQRICFVPTMGNLHEGHLSLVKEAKLRGECVVVSIFVNPLQFGAGEDLDCYPRTLAADKEKLFAEGTCYLFAPTVDEMYPGGTGPQSQLSVPDITETLCGASRPGHFTGVATVVTKLFNIVQPDVAIFGKKDFQQLQVIRKMVDDMCMPVEVVGVDTHRAEDGLALSSRNGFLSDDERAIAPRLHQILQEYREAIANGFDNYAELERHAIRDLSAAGFEPDYFNICDAATLRAVTAKTEDIVILVAARLGSTRLIDNVTLILAPHGDCRMLG
ncbi:pantoate--beta-alanine ligase [Sinobacterium caligoides]|uniref:Pantothenate synthetase n=1 Tax=Sinobacterium caligoides TaxID=933926 RepID=A0A3N2DFR1_9GAMM|nr:pantoate--beta-alanine ligase [Sinobacterium caligoides]ROR98636.1 pantoate--beta-alanine ligase [Sinobacterium caligoides]